MAEKLLRWFLFSVMISLCPLVANGLSLATKGKDAGLGALLGRGKRW